MGRGSIASETLDPRAGELISLLGLAPHLEGGYYRELFRSSRQVRPRDGRTARPGLTTIFFLLPGGARSSWHRIRSDEAWHFYEGAPLELWRAPADASRVERLRLGPLAQGQAPVQIIPAGEWQAARSTGAFTLAGCSVGPGFDFTDFELLADLPEEAARFRLRRPEVAELI